MWKDQGGGGSEVSSGRRNGLRRRMWRERERERRREAVKQNIVIFLSLVQGEGC